MQTNYCMFACFHKFDFLIKKKIFAHIYIYIYTHIYIYIKYTYILCNRSASRVEWPTLRPRHFLYCSFETESYEVEKKKNNNFVNQEESLRDKQLLWEDIGRDNTEILCFREY